MRLSSNILSRNCNRFVWRRLGVIYNLKNIIPPLQKNKKTTTTSQELYSAKRIREFGKVSGIVKKRGLLSNIGWQLDSVSSKSETEVWLEIYIKQLSKTYNWINSEMSSGL